MRDRDFVPDEPDEDFGGNPGQEPQDTGASSLDAGEASAVPPHDRAAGVPPEQDSGPAPASGDSRSQDPLGRKPPPIDANLDSFKGAERAKGRRARSADELS